MNVRAYKLFGKSELAHIRTQVLTIAQQWAKSWAAEECAPIISGCQDAYFVCDTDPRLKWHISSSDEVRQWAAILQDVGEIHVISNVLGVPTTKGNGYAGKEVAGTSMAAALTRKFLQDLTERIIKQAPLQREKPPHCHSHIVEGLPADTWTRGSGALVLEISLNDLTIMLVMSSDLANNYLRGMANPANLKASTTITAPMKAINHLRVGLQARLGNATLSLRELRNLAAGDVIRLDAKLAKPIRIVLNKRDVCGGYLGAYQGNKAVLLKS